MTLRQYGLFISHAWRYSGEYEALVGLLDAAPYFSYRNYSVPKTKPLRDPNNPVSRRLLLGDLDDQIRPASSVIILAGMYAAHSDWIQDEIRIAQGYRKPIIGVIPRSNERTPAVVTAAAHVICGWYTPSIIDAIRTYSV